MLGKTNSGGGGAVASAAEYIFINTTEEVSFPREALTEGADNYFYSTASDQLEAMKAYLDNGNEVAYWGSYKGSWKVLQNSESWSGTPMANTNIAFAFSEPVIPNFFHNRIGSAEWSLRATNDWDVFTSYLNGGASPEFMTSLIESGSDTNITGGVDTAIGDGSTAYKYYVFKDMYNYSYIYNLSLKAQTGNVSCVLKSGNMSPSFKAYPADYMRVVTQPWYNGENVIDSKEMIMKPYADGGCLIGYTDTGAAVNLKMYLLTGTSDPLYLLSPDNSFEKPVGYDKAVQVADLDIPVHLYPVVTVKAFEQPHLSADGTLGGADFAVAADSEIDSNRMAYKAFDGNTVLSDASTDQWHSNSGQPHWIEFYNPQPLTVTAITIYNGADNVLPLEWQFQCSDDNSEWTTMTSGTNTELTANGQWSFDVPNSGEHKYYRFYTTSGSGSDSAYLGLTEIRITGTHKVTEWKIPTVVPPPSQSVEDGVVTE